MAGVDLRTGVKPIGVSRGPSGVTVNLGDRGEITGTDALVAVGREPVTRDLDLDVAGVRTDARGFVEVDDRLAATAPRTWRSATLSAPAVTIASTRCKISACSRASAARQRSAAM